MIELFISAMALGFLFNAAPGAIFTESLRRGLKGGFKSALYVQFGSLVGDLFGQLLVWEVQQYYSKLMQLKFQWQFLVAFFLLGWLSIAFWMLQRKSHQ